MALNQGKINCLNKLTSKEMNIITALKYQLWNYITTWKLAMVIYKVEYIIYKWWLQLCIKLSRYLKSVYWNNILWWSNCQIFPFYVMWYCLQNLKDSLANLISFYLLAFLKLILQCRTPCVLVIVYIIFLAS